MQQSRTVNDPLFGDLEVRSLLLSYSFSSQFLITCAHRIQDEHDF